MNRQTASAFLGIAGVAALSLAFASDLRAAESVGNFYKDKTIKIIVGSDSGGGYDVYARLLARHIGRFIPGNPSFIVQNMPGAGSIAAANNVYAVSPQDGTVIGGLQRGAPFEQILGHQGPQFEATKFKWLGSLNNEVGVLGVWHTAKAKTFDDIKTQEVVFGSSGPNDTEIYPSMLINMLGAKIKLIGGYTSATNVTLAMERGEVEGLSQSWTSMKKQRPHWFGADKKVNILAQIALSKHPDLPDVPLILELINAKNLLPEFTPRDAETIWRIMLTQKSMGRPFTFGPGVPEERVAAVRKAFAQMLTDKEFIADAKKSKTQVVAVSGEEIQAMVERLSGAPKAVLDKVAVVTKPKIDK